MSEEKWYMVKNDKGKYWDFNTIEGLWKSISVARPISEDTAKNAAKEHGGHVVTLIEEPAKIVLTKEQAEIVEEAHVDEYPATHISCNTGDDEEELLMRAYVNGYTVAKEPKYYVKVFNGDRGYLNIYAFNHDEAMISDKEQSRSFKTQFTATEIEQMKQRDDIPLNWDKIKLIEVDDYED